MSSGVRVILTYHDYGRDRLAHRSVLTGLDSSSLPGNVSLAHVRHQFIHNAHSIHHYLCTNGTFSFRHSFGLYTSAVAASIKILFEWLWSKLTSQKGSLQNIPMTLSWWLLQMVCKPKTSANLFSVCPPVITSNENHLLIVLHYWRCWKCLTQWPCCLVICSHVVLWFIVYLQASKMYFHVAKSEDCLGWKGDILWIAVWPHCACSMTLGSGIWP